MAGRFFNDGLQGRFDSTALAVFAKESSSPLCYLKSVLTRVISYLAWRRRDEWAALVDHLDEQESNTAEAPTAKEPAGIRPALDVGRTGVVPTSLLVVLLIIISFGCDPEGSQQPLNVPDSMYSWVKEGWTAGEICDLDAPGYCPCKAFIGLAEWAIAEDIDLQDITNPGLCHIEPWQYCPVFNGQAYGVGELLPFPVNGWCAIGDCLPVLAVGDEFDAEGPTVGMCIPTFQCLNDRDCEFLNLVAASDPTSPWVCRNNKCAQASCPPTWDGNL